MEDREWERIYKDAVADAIALGIHRGESITISRKMNHLYQKMQSLIENAWRDGYETRMEDEYHGTKTSFRDTDWKERCMK